MEWKEAYKLPLHLDSYCMYGLTSENVMALSGFDYNNEDLSKKIIDIINGDKESDFEPEWSIKKGCVIYYKDKFMFDVRGWGYLTGTGALDLPFDDAEKIQDDFKDYVINRLNGR